jgi:hypothetical protein
MVQISFNVERLDVSAPLPRMARYRQHWTAPVLGDLEAPVRAAVAAQAWVAPGDRVAVGIGSRGVARISEIARIAVAAVRDAGGEPFIVPAMGSHGGATPEGQREVLALLGVTEERVQAPVVADVGVVEVGTLANGGTVYFSAVAAQADAILPVNRVKPHTDFRGRIESGVAKMLAIGFGGHLGAKTLHLAARGAADLSSIVPEAARLIVGGMPVKRGLAVVEAPGGHVAEVAGLEPADIAGDLEAALLEKARAYSLGLPFREIDVLIVDQMGKNISGTGMDTNVLGRLGGRSQPGLCGPLINHVVVLNLTPETNGQATGIGLADSTTSRLVSQIDFDKTYVNALAAGPVGLPYAVLPIVLPTDAAAIAAAVMTCGQPDPEDARVVRVRSTHHLEELCVSETLVGEVAEDLERVGDFEPLRFTPEGWLAGAADASFWLDERP